MNNEIFFFFYNLAHKSAFFDGLVVFLAEYFQYAVLLSAFLFLIFHHDILKSENPLKVFGQKWKEIMLSFFSGGFAWLLAYSLKILIHTPRPFFAFSVVAPLFSETGFAFPSGHATFFTALAVSIFLSHKKAGYIFMFFALIISLARVIGGVHFPLDILGGFILGALVAFFAKSV